MKTTLMKTTITRLLLILPLLCGAATSHAAERFAGRFTREGLKFEAKGDQGNYAGTITLGANAFKFTATEKGTDLVGSFETQDGKFDFKAALKGDSLSLTTGGSHYKLGRVNTNPLAKSDGSTKKLKSTLPNTAAIARWRWRWENSRTPIPTTFSFTKASRSFSVMPKPT